MPWHSEQVTQVLTKPRNAKTLTLNITIRMGEDPTRTAAGRQALTIAGRMGKQVLKVRT
jgi:hypothetical protein